MPNKKSYIICICGWRSNLRKGVTRGSSASLFYMVQTRSQRTFKWGGSKSLAANCTQFGTLRQISGSSDKN